MALVLDASAALAWFVQRTDPRESALADEILSAVERDEARVPCIWYTEVVNALLVAERSRGANPSQSSRFLGELDALPIAEDRVQQSSIKEEMLTLARAHSLTAYDALYLELVLRTGGTLATFDRELADATRKAGGCLEIGRKPYQCFAISAPVQCGSPCSTSESIVAKPR